MERKNSNDPCKGRYKGMTWVLSEPFDSLFIIAEEQGVYFRTNSLNITEFFESQPKALKPIGHGLFVVINQLLELGLAEKEENAIRIPYDSFVSLEEMDINIFDSLVPWAPFLIEIGTTGSLGREDFHYRLRFYWGDHQINLDRVGCFVNHLDIIYRLDRQSYNLIEELSCFQNLSPERKCTSDCLISFSKIRGLAEGVGAQIDQFIQKNRVIIPPRIGIDLIEEPDGRISFVPAIEGVPREDLRKVFLQAEDVTNIYIDDGQGGRIRIIFNLEQQEALRRMTKVRHLGGRDKTEVLRNPQSVFDGVAGAIDLEIGDFGPRVKGIGNFPFVVQPVIRISGFDIFDQDNGECPEPRRKTIINAGILCRYADGTEETVLFKDRDELSKFNHNVQTAYQDGTGIVELEGKNIVVDKDFAEGVLELINALKNKSTTEKIDTSGKRKYLLIYENEEDLEYEEKKSLEKFEDFRPTIPNALLAVEKLKKHQLDGLRWLQINYLLKRSGCLLADDMGLGKTLQVLTFLAWVIEEKKLTPEGNFNPEAKPWNPVLVITPVILLENETWIQDIQKFFKNGGDVFRPWCILYGQQLKNMRKPGISGQEPQVQMALLDLEKLREYRLIFTNYETIVNYQFSFAKMKSDWTIIVTDEAQNQKTPKTKISHALKSLAPKFRIACTGTPVETRLLDVWNIFDYLQPGPLMGSAAEFTKTYEKPLNDNPSRMPEILDSLRGCLRFGKSNAFLLRREKAQTLEGLPNKYEHKVVCDLSEEQCELHMGYMIRAKEGGENNHPFALIQGLMKLYQHPALIPRYEPFGPGSFQTILDRCPKVTKFLEILHKIKGKKEKALIFTRSLDMQQLLSGVIYEKFQQRVDIINGAASRNETKSFGMTRKKMIRRFSEDKDLNFIILSPDVAGIGLTFVEANHVLHYGRWWNPAKELQATDRVYRIGQEREVNVYYFIAKDPNGNFKSFDEKLDTLIERRRQMARDFLAPMPSENDLGNELYENIFNDFSSEGSKRKPISLDDTDVLPWDRFEALIAQIERKMGRRVILTPRSGDMGIDVISFQSKTIRLIQCKHRRYGDSLDANVVEETINAFDNYRAHFFSGHRVNLKPVLVTNGQVSNTIKNNCLNRGIELITSKNLGDLLSQYICTLPDVEVMEADRVESMSALKSMINHAT